MPNFERNQRLPLTITYACEPSLIASFLRMFAVWNFACDGIFKLQMGSQPATLTMQVGDMPVALALTSPFGAAATIAFRAGATVSDVTMLHELGHALGLDHSGAAHSIMNPIPTGTKTEATLVQDDIDGVRQLYDLPPKTFDAKVTMNRVAAFARPLWGKPTTLRFPLVRGANELDISHSGISVYKTVMR